jgi:hypothetical protein
MACALKEAGPPTMRLLALEAVATRERISPAARFHPAGSALLPAISKAISRGRMPATMVTPCARQPGGHA